MTARARGRAARANELPTSRGLDARDVAIAVALAVVTAALYAPVRTHAFLDYDDNEYVTENPAVRAGLGRASVAWALTHAHQATWHPLTTLTHLADVSLFGLDAGAHLLVNVALHALATAGLFLVLVAMTKARTPSAFVAAAFAWHPLHVESVAWVSERKDVLSGLFWMATLAAYVGFVRRPTTARRALLIAVYALGLLAKPMLVTLPFVLLLLDHWPLRRAAAPSAATARAWLALAREKAPLLVLAAVVSAITVVAQRNAGALNALAAAPFSYRLGNAFVSYVTYLRKTVWPSDLVVFYPPSRTLSGWAALAAAALVAVATVAALRAARRAPYLAVGWLWYLGTLVPVIGLVRQGDQAMADRFTYLPSIGLFVMAAWSADALARRTPAAGRSLAALGAATLGAWLVATAAQIAHWRDTESLFAHALAVDEANYLAHANLGVALDARGDRAGAARHYARAVELEPTYAKARVSLGSALARDGRTNDAEAQYREALRLDPGSAIAAYDLGLLLAERGDLDAALVSYRRALAIDPDYAKAWNNLGWALAAKGTPAALADAVGAYDRALAIDPDLTAAHNNLALALDGLGRGDEALAHSAAAVRLAPDEPRAHATYAALLANQGRVDEAIAAYREALRLAPDFTDVRTALDALVAARDGKRAAATPPSPAAGSH